MQHLFAPSALEKGLSFVTQKDAQVPDFLLGDELRLQQVLVNLIGNAVKFTLQGSVSLQVSLLNNDDTEALIRFSVSDTGIGISDNAIDKLFNPFSQADTSTTRNFGGTGLGLSISDKLVQLMQGKFNVTSTLGEGSTFSVIVPLGIDASADTRIVEPQFAKTETGGLTAALQKTAQTITGSHILVVEDYDLNQQVITEYLELSGMTVDVANNGKEALSMLATTHYDAVLMDVQMPVMGGIEATTLLRQQAHFANLPVIALTGGVTQEERAQCYACGMNAFVNKPIKMQELLSVLKDYL
jgi:CheY-like chemotaxis protein